MRVLIQIVFCTLLVCCWPILGEETKPAPAKPDTPAAKPARAEVVPVVPVPGVVRVQIDPAAKGQMSVTLAIGLPKDVPTTDSGKLKARAKALELMADFLNDEADRTKNKAEIAERAEKLAKQKEEKAKKDAEKKKPAPAKPDPVPVTPPQSA
jgi:hypothetical protein